MATNQPGHFFDRVAAKDAGAAGIRKVYVMHSTATGRYFLSDTAVVAGATRVYFHDEVDGRAHLDTTEAGARSATLFGSVTVQL